MSKDRGGLLSKLVCRFRSDNSAIPAEASKQGSARVKALNKLWFLADAPEFIDRQQVERLYEAIFQPEFEATSRTLTRGDSKAEELLAEISASGGISIPAFFKYSASGKVSEKSGNTSSQERTVVEAAITSSERRLEKLVNLYVYSHPHRFLWLDHDLITAWDFTEHKRDWVSIDDALNEPGLRPIVVLDLKKGTKLIPMFAELTDGTSVDIYKSLIQALPGGDCVPEYPLFGAKGSDTARQTYWQKLWNVFNSTTAMEQVEQSTKSSGGKLSWIDFRLVGFTANKDPVPIHLHVSPRGEYPTGTFAYHFIRRGEKYGLRILGTLKKGADINVLAIYQR